MYNVYIDCLVCGDSKYHEDVILDKNDCFTCDYCIDKKKEKEDMINLIKKNYKTMKKKELLTLFCGICLILGSALLFSMGAYAQPAFLALEWRSRRQVLSRNPCLLRRTEALEIQASRAGFHPSLSEPPHLP
mgnify:CR=1 FL=1